MRFFANGWILLLAVSAAAQSPDASTVDPSTETVAGNRVQRQPLGKLDIDPAADMLVQLAFRKAGAKPEVAGCYWRSAQQLDPDLARADLSFRGAAISALAGLDRWNWGDPAIFSVGGDVKPPRKLYYPQPQYSPRAGKERIQGIIITQAIVDDEGNVVNVRVIRNLDPELDVQAIKALCSWQFEPATRNGEPVAVHYYLTFRFGLGRRIR